MSCEICGQDELQVMLMALVWGSVKTLRDLGAALGLNSVLMNWSGLIGPTPSGPTKPTANACCSQAARLCTVAVKLFVNILAPETNIKYISLWLPLLSCHILNHDSDG